MRDIIKVSKKILELVPNTEVELLSDLNKFISDNKFYPVEEVLSDKLPWISLTSIMMKYHNKYHTAYWYVSAISTLSGRTYDEMVELMILGKD